MTYGYDVSSAISELIFNEKAMGRKLQIATAETMTWRQIWKLYYNVLSQVMGASPKMYLCDTMHAIDELYEGRYNTIYDRVFNRSFDSRRIEDVIGHRIEYVKMREGIEKCQRNFLKKENYLQINWQFEA